MEKIKIKEAIVVEGKYDRIKLSNLFDTVIITTDGFDIYRNKGKMEMLNKQGGIVWNISFRFLSARYSWTI